MASCATLSSRKGRALSFSAFSFGNRAEIAAKIGNGRKPPDDSFCLHMSPFSAPTCTTENRGVPGSSPGLAIIIDFPGKQGISVRMPEVVSDIGARSGD
jgi:hypothetical protein